MITLTHRPIEGWEGDETSPDERRRSQFATAWKNTLEDLDRELRMLDATNVTLGLDLTPGQIRNDGQPRADAKPFSPRVVIAFETKAHGTLTYRCDRFNTWQDNVRAIALGLEALRRVERYGISDRGQQYMGYKALGAGTPMPAARMTRDEAAQLLVDFAVDDDGCNLFEVVQLLADPHAVQSAFRSAIKHAHEDAGGVDDVAAKIIEARDILQETAQ
jgi:hypothetical protein